MFCHKSFVYLSPLECTRMSREEKNKLRFVMEKALELFYNSDTFSRLKDANTSLYYQSAGYIYSFLQNELKFCDYRRL